MANADFMKLAAESALEGVRAGHGGPFGAAIVQNGELLVTEHNRVLQTQDPTMHAEVAAIRAACGLLGRFSLHDCEIYSTCMPCPMCMSAIIWAKIPKLYYGASAKDAAAAGFDDDYIYEFIRSGLTGGNPEIEVFQADECRRLFDYWREKKDRQAY